MLIWGERSLILLCIIQNADVIMQEMQLESVMIKTEFHSSGQFHYTRCK